MNAQKVCIETLIYKIFYLQTTDLSTAHKEIDRLKEEINGRDIKIKWTQNKLKTEIEAHKVNLDRPY